MKPLSYLRTSSRYGRLEPGVGLSQNLLPDLVHFLRAESGDAAPS